MLPAVAWEFHLGSVSHRMVAIRQGIQLSHLTSRGHLWGVTTLSHIDERVANVFINELGL